MMTMMEKRTLYGTPQRSKSISTSVSTPLEKEATVTDLTWVDTTHKISEIVSRSPPLLPILIKCAALSSEPYIAAKIQPGDIMKLSRLQTIDVVQATVEFKSSAAQHLKDLDEYNGVQLPSFLAIPKSMESISFEVVRGSVRYSTPLGQEGLAFSSKTSVKSSTQPSVRFKTVQALSRQLPRFVKVIKTSKQIRQNTKIVEGHVLEIMGVHSPWATRDKFLSCRIDQPDGHVCKLDMKWRGTFDTIPDTKRYNVQDLLRVYRLPITVRVRDFSPTEWIPQKTSSQLKAIKTLDLSLTIEKEETMEFAMAISQTPSSSSSSSSSLDACLDPSAFQLMILSKNIDVDFVTSSDMTMNPKGYAEVMTRMGSIGDSMVSMISKDIYLNEYGSPMTVMVPFSDLQPKVYGTPIRVRSRSPIQDECGTPKPQARRASSHHYIDLDINEGIMTDHDGVSEYVHDIEEEDPYESLSAIQKNAERESCGSPLREEGLDDYNQSPDDESSTDYTILRSPSTLFPSPNMPNFWRLHRPLTDTMSYYQVPKNTCADEDIYIVEDGGRPFEEELDTQGIAGNFQGKRSLKSRCSDSLPREPPPPVPDRIPALRHHGHKTLDRAESSPIHMGSLPWSTSQTLGPSMKLCSLDVPSSGAMGFNHRKPFSPGPKPGAGSAMSSMLLEMRARHSVRESAVVRDDLEYVAEKPEVQPIDDLPPPPLPPPLRDDSCSCYGPSPVRSSELPSPPSEDDMHNLAELPIADFPPPLPKRSSSLASLSSLASITSLASVASAASGSSAVCGATSMNSATSIDSLTSLMSTVSAPENHCFQDAVKTLKSSTGNHYPTLPHKLPVDRLQDKGSVKINRSQSCSPTRLRNLSAARRKLPELPIPEQQPEVPLITEFTFYEAQPNSTIRRARPSSSGNILEEDREPPPLPPDRACSMENLLRHDEGNRSPQQPPPTPHRHTPSKQSLKSSPGRRSYFPPNHAKKQSPTIPVANIAPRPSPLDMMHSLMMSRDRGYPKPPDRSSEGHVTFSEDDGDNDDDDDYLHPQSEMATMRYNKTDTSSLRPKKRIVSTSGLRNIPTPPTVPTRISRNPTANLPRSNGIKSLKDIPIDIVNLSCDQIARALALLNIRDDIIDNLKSVQMNGELLKSMSEEILQKEFQMSQFYAIKVIKFVNGWRP